MTGRLSGRLALITGASRGIGAAVARRFAAEGARVILVARTRGGLEEVDDAIRRDSEGTRSATLIQLDLARLDEVDKIGPTLVQRFGGLDILVANAGVLGELAPVSHIDAAAWHQVIDINLHANWRLIRTLEPLLRASASGRAIFVSSGAAEGRRPYWGSYAVSKAALEMLVRCWAAETERTSLRINLVNPGPTRTNMRATAYPGEDPNTLKPPEAVTETFVTLALPSCQWHGERIVVDGEVSIPAQGAG